MGRGAAAVVMRGAFAASGMVTPGTVGLIPLPGAGMPGMRCGMACVETEAGAPLRGICVPACGGMATGEFAGRCCCMCGGMIPPGFCVVP